MLPQAIEFSCGVASQRDAFHHEAGAFAGIASLVRVYPCAPDLILDTPMGMAVHPEVRLVALDKPFQVGVEGR